jgi:Tub family
MNGSLLGGGNGGLMMNGGLLSGTSAGSAAAGRSSFASRGAPMMAPGSLTGGLGSAGSFSLSPHNPNVGGGLLSGGGLTSPSVASSVTATTSSATSTAAANALPSSAPVSTADSEAAAIAEALKEREKRSAHSSGSDGFGGASAADHSGGGSSPGKQLYAPIQPIIIPPSVGMGMSASAGAGGSGGAVTGLAALDLTDLRRFLTSPVPKNAGIIYCRIERDRSGLTGKWYPSYYLYLQVKETADNNIANTLAAGHSSSSSGGSAAGAGKNLPKGVTSTADIFLLASKKRTANKTSNYLLSMDKRDLNRDSDSFLGKVRSNYFGTEFTIFDDGLAPSDAAAAAAAATKKGLKGGRGSESKMALRQEIASVQYASNVLAARGPRRMKIVIPRILPDGRPVSFQPET